MGVQAVDDDFTQASDIGLDTVEIFKNIPHWQVVKSHLVSEGLLGDSLSVLGDHDAGQEW